MNNDKIASFRSFLIQKKESIQMSAHHTTSRLKVSDSACADPFDHAAVEIHKDVELICRHKEWRQLLDIQETLIRMERGFFGICDHCGRKISAKRLEALPMTRYCVTCQSEFESPKIKTHHKVRPSGKATGNDAR